MDQLIAVSMIGPDLQSGRREQAYLRDFRVGADSDCAVSDPARSLVPRPAAGGIAPSLLALSHRLLRVFG